MGRQSNGLPVGYAVYKRTASFTHETVPKGLLHRHSTKAGVWALLRVSRGALEFFESVEGNELRQVVTAGQHAVIRPEVEHRVAPLGEVEFDVEFWRAAAAGTE
jgi:tellurite resistance-related uncharacterized protein